MDRHVWEFSSHTISKSKHRIALRKVFQKRKKNSKHQVRSTTKTGFRYRIQLALKMSATAVPLSNTRNGYTIVTQMICPPTSTQQIIYAVGPLQKFLKGKPKLLGAFQITIGVLKFLLGIAMIFNSFMFTSGIAFWCALVYIITGSLAVSASKNLHRCVVTGALVMNVISIITAVITITMASLFLAFVFSPCYYGCSMSPNFGIVVWLVICSIIQFIISIYLSAFACKATCSDEPPVNITVAPNQAGCPDYPFEQYLMYAVNGANMNSIPMERPPPYNEIKDNGLKTSPDDTTITL
ncbi:hypothetical protein AOLI_G00003690 [Acnodon oligacanthus]